MDDAWWEFLTLMIFLALGPWGAYGRGSLAEAIRFLLGTRRSASQPR